MTVQTFGQTEMTLRVPCKVNLNLEVLGRRDDGFHDLRSVMQAVDLCDELTLRLRDDGRVRLRCDAPGVPDDDRNLVVRAARLMQQRYGVQRGVEMHLLKRVPTGGGLGGGSADAAATLLALSEMWGIDAPPADLAPLAAELGSDVAFFLWGGRALCEGRGERVTPMPAPEGLSLVLVLPGYHVATGEVYAAWERRLTNCRVSGEDGPWSCAPDAALGGVRLRNDLQGPALALDERLSALWRRIREAAPESGADAAMLSGSGSSFLVSMRNAVLADEAAAALQSALGVPCIAVQGRAAWNGRAAALTL
jgi:4-diphosphocytidyl-2-C-methyl-D-erythritol kinase